jgi:tRNA pseudouridine55 synthase
VLAEEIAAALGTLGHVSLLRRISVEPFADEPMQTLGRLEEEAAQGAAPQLLPADYPLRHLPAVSLTATDAARLLKGQSVLAAGALAAGLPEGETVRVRLYDPERRFLGLGIADHGGAVRPKRLLNQ